MWEGCSLMNRYTLLQSISIDITLGLLLGCRTVVWQDVEPCPPFWIFQLTVPSWSLCNVTFLTHTWFLLRSLNNIKKKAFYPLNYICINKIFFCIILLEFRLKCFHLIIIIRALSRWIHTVKSDWLRSSVTGELANRCFQEGGTSVCFCRLAEAGAGTSRLNLALWRFLWSGWRRAKTGS